MAKIAYVVTVHNKVTDKGEIRVYYTNGKDRRYRPDTMPQTVFDFCVTARTCDNEETHDEHLNTYY